MLYEQDKTPYDLIALMKMLYISLECDMDFRDYIFFSSLFPFSCKFSPEIQKQLIFLISSKVEGVDYFVMTELSRENYADDYSSYLYFNTVFTVSLCRLSVVCKLYIVLFDRIVYFINLKKKE